MLTPWGERPYIRRVRANGLVVGVIGHGGGPLPAAHLVAPPTPPLESSSHPDRRPRPALGWWLAIALGVGGHLPWPPPDRPRRSPGSRWWWRCRDDRRRPESAGRPCRGSARLVGSFLPRARRKLNSTAAAVGGKPRTGPGYRRADPGGDPALTLLLVAGGSPRATRAGVDTLRLRDLSRYRARSGSPPAAISIGVIIAVIICHRGRRPLRQRHRLRRPDLRRTSWSTPPPGHNNRPRWSGATPTTESSSSLPSTPTAPPGPAQSEHGPGPSAVIHAHSRRSTQ